MDPETREFTIIPTHNVYGGETLSRLPDGRAVFTPFTIPGETVRIRVIDEKRGYCRAVLVEVLEPAPERISPRCKHFGLCGGCHYQHLPYEIQLDLKRGVLIEQLERIAGMQDPPVKACMPTPDPYYYRNHVQFHLDPEGKLGYFQTDGQTVFPIQECLLIEQAIADLWPQLEFEIMPEIERIGIRAGAEADLQLILESSGLELPEINVEGLPISVAHLSPAGTLVLAGSDRVIMQVLDRTFQVSAGSFFQINTGMAGRMVEHLLENLDIAPGITLLDAYCGVGLFSAFLAPKCLRVIGVESSPSACGDFTQNLDEFDHVELYEAPVEDVLTHIQDKIDLIVLDPPRAGIHRRAMDGLIKLSPPRLVYVSCDPATLARDAKKLVEQGYRLDQVTPFDLFPQTYHIESISFWSK